MINISQELLVTTIVAPTVGAIIWFGKAWLKQYQSNQTAWLKQTAEITTAFVDHTIKQTVMLEAIRLNLEQLNKIVIEQQKQQTKAILSTLETITESLKKHQEETQKVTEKQGEALSNICSHLSSNDVDIHNQEVYGHNNRKAINANKSEIADIKSR